MNIELNYGEKKVDIEINNKNILQILQSDVPQDGLKGEDETERALDEVIGTATLETLFVEGDNVAIVVGDAAQLPESFGNLLAQLLCRLHLSGVRAEDIKIIFAQSDGKKLSGDEMRRTIGDALYEVYYCQTAGCDGYIDVGMTDSGTPVSLCKHIATAGKRICTGAIEYNQFAGYSGGGWALATGAVAPCTRKALSEKILEEPVENDGIYDNPAREYMNRVMEFCPVNFIVDIITDENHEIIRVVAGSCSEAHRAGCDFLDKAFLVPLKAKADIVMVSTGGRPYDNNLVRAGAALRHVARAVKENGTIIWLAACDAGCGEGSFPAEPVVAGNAVGLVSELQPQLVRSLGMRPYLDIEFALDSELARHGEAARIIVVPQGVKTLPGLPES